jgi:Transposase DDE domain group 1
MPSFDKLRSSQTKLRTYASFTYQAGSWTRPRKVVARLECSPQPDAGDSTTGMRQEVDIRYVVTSLKGTAQHLYEDVYCQRGQMENLIKLHKAQLALDRMSCHSATANQVRLVLHTAAFWLMHCVRSAVHSHHGPYGWVHRRLQGPKPPAAAGSPSTPSRPHRPDRPRATPI